MEGDFKESIYAGLESKEPRAPPAEDNVYLEMKDKTSSDNRFKDVNRFNILKMLKKKLAKKFRRTQIPK